MILDTEVFLYLFKFKKMSHISPCLEKFAKTIGFSGKNAINSNNSSSVSTNKRSKYNNAHSGIKSDSYQFVRKRCITQIRTTNEVFYRRNILLQ